MGVSVLLAPQPGELARSCLPGAKEDGLLTSTIRWCICKYDFTNHHPCCSLYQHTHLILNQYNEVYLWFVTAQQRALLKHSFYLEVQELTNLLSIGLVTLYKTLWPRSALRRRYFLSFEISFESNVSGFLQIGGQDEDPLPKRASPLCCSTLRLFLQLLHDGDGRTINFLGETLLWDNFRTFSLMRRTIKSRNSFCTPTFPATTTSTCKNHNRSVIITKDITTASWKHFVVVLPQQHQMSKKKQWEHVAQDKAMNRRNTTAVHCRFGNKTSSKICHTSGVRRNIKKDFVKKTTAKRHWNMRNVNYESIALQRKFSLDNLENPPGRK